MHFRCSDVRANFTDVSVTNRSLSQHCKGGYPLDAGLRMDVLFVFNLWECVVRILAPF